MANQRMISRSISTSKKLTKLYDAHKTERDPSFPLLLFTWLQPHVDDFGRYDSDPFTIKYNIVPTLEDKSVEDISIALGWLEEEKLIFRYTINGDVILQVINFDEHQRGLNKRTKSKYPDPPNVDSDSISEKEEE